MKIKIYVNFFSLSRIGTESIKNQKKISERLSFVLLIERVLIEQAFKNNTAVSPF